MAAVWIILGVVALLVAASVAAGYFMYRFAVVRRKEPPPPDPATAPNAVRRRYAEGLPAQMAWLRAWGYEDVEITGAKGGRLHGYLFRAKTPTKRIALAVHGYRCGGGLREYLYFAPMYLEALGMDLLIVDDYAHAQSEGKRIGFGWMDRLDCLLWIDWIDKTLGPGREILLQGVSMGAACVLMTAGQAALPANVRWVVADCGFTSVKEEILHAARLSFRVPAFPLYHIATLFCKLLAGYFFGEGNTLAQVKNIGVPVLFIHGDMDGFVPTGMVHRLHAACRAPKRLWLVPGAAHAESYLTDPAGYLAQVTQLLDMAPDAGRAGAPG